MAEFKPLHKLDFSWSFMVQLEKLNVNLSGSSHKSELLLRNNSGIG